MSSAPPTARLLLIEDDARFAQALVPALVDRGFEVTHCDDGLLGLDLAGSEAWSAVILDLMLPTLDGRSLLRRLRRRCEVPVLVISARFGLDQRIGALEDGADDYLTKPFELEDLVARIRVALRRAVGTAQRKLGLGDLVVDLYARTLERDGVPVALTATEYRIFEVLLRRRGRATSAGELAQSIALDGDPITATTVRIHVSNLRKKLGQATIANRRGLGYLIPEET